MGAEPVREEPGAADAGGPEETPAPIDGEKGRGTPSARPDDPPCDPEAEESYPFDPADREEPCGVPSLLGREMPLDEGGKANTLSPLR